MDHTPITEAHQDKSNVPLLSWIQDKVVFNPSYACSTP
jgi:hypothetical protein